MVIHHYPSEKRACVQTEERSDVWSTTAWRMKRKETTEEKHQVIELKLKVWPGGWERLCITHANRDNRDNDLHLNLCQPLLPDREDGVYGVISELYKPLLDRSHLDEPCVSCSLLLVSVSLSFWFFMLLFVSLYLFFPSENSLPY